MKRLIIAMLLMACAGRFSTSYAFPNDNEMHTFGEDGFAKLKAKQCGWELKVYYQLEVERKYSGMDYCRVYIDLFDKDGFSLQHSRLGDYRRVMGTTLTGDFETSLYVWKNAETIQFTYER